MAAEGADCVGFGRTLQGNGSVEAPSRKAPIEETVFAPVKPSLAA